MTVGSDVAGGAGVTIKEFAGGLYAVARCEGLQTITDTWHRLATWCEGSPYVMGQHQWLEECFTLAPTASRITSLICTCRSQNRQVVLWRRRCLTQLVSEKVNEVSNDEMQCQHDTRKSVSPNRILN